MNEAKYQYTPLNHREPLPEGFDSKSFFRTLIDPMPHGTETLYFETQDLSEGSWVPRKVVIAFDPFERWIHQGGQGEVQSALGPVMAVETDPFQFVSERLAQFKLQLEPESKVDESACGVYGYFAYDSIRWVERKLVVSQGNLGDSAKTDALPDSEFFFFGKTVVIDSHKNEIQFQTVYFPSLGNTQKEKAVLELKNLRDAFEKFVSLPLNQKLDRITDEITLEPEEFKVSLGKEEFEAGFKKLKNHIKNGDIFQAVLAERLEIPFSGHPFRVFEILSKLNPAPYQYFLSTKNRTVLGASPEMLLKNTAGTLETHPIAGTRPSVEDPSQDEKFKRQLLTSSKEGAEHLMLVDLARNDVGRVASAGTVQVTKFRQVLKFGSVMHLVSEVKGQLLKGTSAVLALRACFPAGTLSGAPKVRAMQLLSEIEPVCRGFYGGAVVSASINGDLDSCIAIRSIEFRSGKAFVQAGAGIVADSALEREYEEISAKTRLTRKALSIALKEVTP